MRIVLLLLMSGLVWAQIPPEPAHIQVFQATARAVRRGASVTLRWSAAGVDRVRLEPLGQDLPARGELTQPVSGRTIFWLHATNQYGGQSVPLVVELLPDDQAFPNLNGVQPLPEVGAPVPAAPAILPEPLPVLVARPPKRRLIRRAGPRPAWIQFAAMVNPRYIGKLQRNLARAAATEATLWFKARRSGAPMQFIRSGPFANAQAARRRLRELAPVLASLRLRPIIITGQGQSSATSTLEVASVRNLQTAFSPAP